MCEREVIPGVVQPNLGGNIHHFYQKVIFRNKLLGPSHTQAAKYQGVGIIGNYWIILEAAYCNYSHYYYDVNC